MKCGKKQRNSEKEGPQDECDKHFAKCIADKVDPKHVRSQ